MQRNRFVAIGIASLILLIASSLVWLLSRDQADDVAWEQVQQSGVIRVGMDAAYPPFEEVGPDGQLIGFDVDLAYELGERLGFDIELHNITYDALYDALLTGKVELLISALVVAPEFYGKADFSIPYFNAGEQLIVPVGSALSSMEDLAGHTLAVEYGSGGDVEARQWERRLVDMAIHRTGDPSSTLQAVINGEADAALVDGISARLGAGQYPELVIVSNVVETFFAVAAHPDSDELREQVNTTLLEMMEDGTVDELLDKWFTP